MKNLAEIVISEIEISEDKVDFVHIISSFDYVVKNVRDSYSQVIKVLKEHNIRHDGDSIPTLSYNMYSTFKMQIKVSVSKMSHTDPMAEKISDELSKIKGVTPYLILGNIYIEA